MLKKKIKKVFKIKAILASLLLAAWAIAPFVFVERSPAFPTGPEPIVSIDDNLLNAIIQVESSNNPKAYNRYTKARGLTQIRLIAWNDLRKHYGNKYKKLNYYRDIYNPAVAREAGKDYLRIIVKYLKAKRIRPTYQNVLTAYVWGPSNLYKYGLNRSPKSAKKYVSKVMRLAQISY